MNYFQYVPSMESNLINLGQLLDMNYTTRLTDKELKVFDASSKLILKLPLSNKKTLQNHDQRVFTFNALRKSQLSIKSGFCIRDMTT